MIFEECNNFFPTVRPAPFEPTHFLSLNSSLCTKYFNGEHATKSMELNSSLEAYNTLCYSINSQPFMQPECSLPCTQELATGPCTELDGSSLHPRNMCP